jgi:hypothetical protein
MKWLRHMNPMGFAAIYAFTMPLVLGLIAFWCPLREVWDWSAIGTWVGAGVTAGAVYWAGTISDRNARKAEGRDAQARLTALAGLYHEARFVLTQADDYLDPDAKIGGGAKPPDVDRCSDLLEALKAVEVLWLPGNEAVTNHFQVKRGVSDAMALNRSGLGGWADDANPFKNHLRDLNAAVEHLRARLKEDYGLILRQTYTARVGGDHA